MCQELPCEFGRQQEKNKKKISHRTYVLVKGRDNVRLCKLYVSECFEQHRARPRENWHSRKNM